MRKLSLLFLFATFTFSLAAQSQYRNILRISPLGFVNKGRISFERAITNTISIGGAYSYYYNLFPGQRGEGMLRAYVVDDAPKGFYVQAKGVYGTFNPKIMKRDANNQVYVTKNVEFTSYGGGLALGYQWLVGGKERLVFDFNLGVKIMTYPVTLRSNSQEHIRVTDSKGNDYGDCSTLYHLTGPGSFIDTHFMIGWAF